MGTRRGTSVRLEEAGRRADIVLCRAPVNELCEELVDELNCAIDVLSPRARAVTITSEVDRVFMAGGDIELMRSGSPDSRGTYVRRLQETFCRLENLPLPIVVGIDGACLGGGLEMALACDIRVASPAVRLGLPEVTLGIIAGAGGIQRLVRAIGQGPARDLLLTGRQIDAAEAKQIGILSRVVESGSAADAARAIATELASGAGEAIQATKRLAVGASEGSIEAGTAREWSEWMQVRRSANSTEGLAAFLEKREPRFE